MTATTAKPMTLAEYLNFYDGTDTRYELIDGQPVAMSTESDLNDRIALFLQFCLLQAGIPFYCLSMKTLIAVSGRLANARQPDLTVLSEESAAALKGAKHRLITHDMPPPMLVVEVVSPKQGDRDYRHKRTEYAGRHIQEYWIVDPILQKVTVMEWVDGLYQEQCYENGQLLASNLFPDLQLTAEQILAAEHPSA
ncbi:MAG: Uma2 family endonuclease [Cyanobacteria bacterium J06632_22]